MSDICRLQLRFLICDRQRVLDIFGRVPDTETTLADNPMVAAVRFYEIGYGGIDQRTAMDKAHITYEGVHSHGVDYEAHAFASIDGSSSVIVANIFGQPVVAVSATDPPQDCSVAMDTTDERMAGIYFSTLVRVQARFREAQVQQEKRKDLGVANLIRELVDGAPFTAALHLYLTDGCLEVHHNHRLVLRIEIDAQGRLLARTATNDVRILSLAQPQEPK